MLGWRVMECIKKCERTLDPRHGNMMAPVVTCLTWSLLPIVLVGEGSIKACLILGQEGAEVRVVIVCTASSRWCWIEPLSRNLVRLFITYCCLFVPPPSVFDLFTSSLQFSNLVLVFYSSVTEYPSIQWFWRSSSVSYL